MPKGSTRPTPGRARDLRKAREARTAARRNALGQFEPTTPQNTPGFKLAGRLSRGNLGKRVAQPKKRKPSKVSFGSPRIPRKRSKT